VTKKEIPRKKPPTSKEMSVKFNVKKADISAFLGMGKIGLFCV
jgi:hypothetical protein